eukprot:gene2119-4140_t
MNLFGRKKEQPKPDTNAAIQLLKANIDILEKRKEHISTKINGFLSEAKHLMQKKDKKGAMFALKKKKMLESELSKIEGATLTLSSQQQTLESASVNVQVFNALKIGAGALQAIHQDLNADKVEDIMEDIEEQNSLQQQISDAIASPAADMFNDDDLLKELEELEEVDTAEQMVQWPSVPVHGPTAVGAPSLPLPSVPTGKIQASPPVIPTSAEAEEERMLRELESSMMA